jgi:hypothetical protein
MENKMADSSSAKLISRRAILWSGALVVAFLLGFVPQFLGTRAVRQELSAAREELARAQSQAELAVLRDLIAVVHLEASQKNYGLAAQRSTSFFDHLQDLVRSETDADRKRALDEILKSRDAVTAGLANGDPGVVTEIQRLFHAVHAATGRS